MPVLNLNTFAVSLMTPPLKISYGSSPTILKELLDVSNSLSLTVYITRFGKNVSQD
jgi:hypothetical protein